MPPKPKPKKKQPKPKKPRPSLHEKNQLNELTGDRWMWFTKSLVTTTYPMEFGHKLRKAHGANKPPRLMQEQIEFFTKGGGLVLDPFAGVGGTLIGASIAEPPRRAIGIEINQEWVDIYREVCEQEGMEPQEMLVGDCLQIMPTMEPGSIDFIATDPPYNIHVDKTMCDGKYGWANRETDYNMRSQEERDFANLQTYDAYLDAMQQTFVECHRLLKPGAHMTVILRNAYQEGRYFLTNALVAARAEAAGLTLKGEKIWYQGGTPLRPYGYPFGFVPNIVHQFILIFQRPKERK
ncbi:MAG: site-specific DNA-methyltransferase [Armatimonadetes bacterium]|nr:site-specific DNA-methyltransferase [Armatimonadota bacterium]